MLSVLVIDDDADLLEMVEMVLSNSSMKVATMRSGMGVMEKLAAVNPGIIVMDIYLGDSDGRELCKAIKAHEQFKHLPVILYSAGIITPESIKESLADHFIAKPFQNEQLVTSIHSLVNRPAAQSA